MSSIGWGIRQVAIHAVNARDNDVAIKIDSTLGALRAASDTTV